MARKMTEAQRLAQEQKKRNLQELAALGKHWDGLDVKDDTTARPVPRAEVPPPESPHFEKSKYNPDGLVDIVTFCEHPYYCALRLYPWQRLILKAFYMGSPGNTHLSLDDVPKDEQVGCHGCVWEHNRKEEEKFIKLHEAGKGPPNSYMRVDNSPCLTCERFCPLMRKARYQIELDSASTPQQEKAATHLSERDVVDQYTTEKGLLDDLEFDQDIRLQVEAKLRNKFTELVLVLGRRSGKMLALDTPLLTTSGWKTMGTVSVEDYVFAPDGTPTMVVAKSDVNYEEQGYEMEFSNGEIIQAGASHQWCTYTKAQRKRASRGKYSKSPVEQTFTTEEIARSLYAGEERLMLKKGSSTEYNSNPTRERNHAIEITKALIYPTREDLGMHPYLMGVFLGEGCFSNNYITSLDPQILEYASSVSNHDIPNSKCVKKSWYVGRHRETNKRFVDVMKKEDVFRNKHIPRKYLESSVEQRLELLCGLNDTYGYVDPIKKSIEFCACNERLAYDYYELVCGLGFKAAIKKSDAALYGRKTSDRYRITYSVPEGVRAFRLDRKQKSLDDRIHFKTDIGRIFITRCDPMPSHQGMQCIQVAHSSHCYLAGKTLVKTHNSFMVSVIALYEVYQLLMMDHPQGRYGLLDLDEISIINVAVSEGQAKTAIFAKVKPLTLGSPFFQPYIGKDTELEIRFLTPYDQRENERRKKNFISPFMGSIALKCGHSNAPGLVGSTCWCIIIDELAAMAGETPDSGNDFKLYEDLKPATATFGKDGKILSLSNPKGEIGLLWKLYATRTEDASTLIFQLATWLTNPNVDQTWLAEKKEQDPISFPMQYGAKFSAASEHPFLPEDVVDAAFAQRKYEERSEHPTPLVHYYAHLDPARTSDYYALAVVHLENLNNGEMDGDGKPARVVVVDHVHFWKPRGKNVPIDTDVIDDYVIKLNERFHFQQVSYDQWHSTNSIMKLKRHGMNAVMTSFTKEYQDKVFTQLHSIFMKERITFYGRDTRISDPATGNIVSLGDATEARRQFKKLQKKFNGKRYKIEALTGEQDDICDAVAGAVNAAFTAKVYQSLPRPMTTSLPSVWR